VIQPRGVPRGKDGHQRSYWYINVDKVCVADFIHMYNYTDIDNRCALC